MAYLTLVKGIPVPKNGGRKVEGEICLPPSKTPLFKGDFNNLVEVEVNFILFFNVLSVKLLKTRISAEVKSVSLHHNCFIEII